MKKFTFKILASLAIVLWGLVPTMAQSDYGTDVIVNNVPTTNQRKPSLAIAGNGWLYAAYVTNVGTTYGYQVYKSTNNGQNWSNFDNYSTTSEIWYGVKVTVCGPAPYKVFITKLRSFNSSGYYNLYISEYDGTTAAWNGNRFTHTTTTTLAILDFDLVADDLFPSYGSTPYGVGLLYSRRSGIDSIKFVYSTNGGTNFAAPVTVATTGSFYGKVSLAYARSNSYSNGRYNAAWEQKTAGSARTGRILWARNTTYIYSPFTTPVYLDVEGSTTGKCFNPKIACQFNNTDNDSSNVTAVVLMERVFSAGDNDVIGYYNNRVSSYNNWYRLDIENNSYNSKQPDINYDSYYNNFLVTYWDSTHTYLPYVVHGFNITPANQYTWPLLAAHYNDNTTMGSLLQPYPVVEINNDLHQVAHLWSREGTGGNGVMMFDAEYRPVAINELITYNNNKINNIYPNPAYGAANIEIELSKSAKVEINAYDISGKKICNLYNAQTPEGISTISFDVSNLANGNYVIEMLTSDSRTTTKMMVAHQ